MKNNEQLIEPLTIIKFEFNFDKQFLYTDFSFQPKANHWGQSEANKKLNQNLTGRIFKCRSMERTDKT